MRIATGNFIAFIDDDEFAIQEWLLTLFHALREYDADGVLAPVNPHFDQGAPQWVVKGGFYDRPVLEVARELIGCVVSHCTQRMTLRMRMLRSRVL